MRSLTFLALPLAALACSNYYKISGAECADTCLDDTIGICPASVIVNFGGLSDGLCSDEGFNVPAGSTSQAAGPCGTLTFNKYSKALLASASVLDASLSTLEDLNMETVMEAIRAGPEPPSCSWSTRDFACVPKASCELSYSFGDSLTEVCKPVAPKTCPSPSVIDVNPSVYFSGRWFEIATTERFRTQTEAGLTCISADYYFNPCDKDATVAVVNNGMRADGTHNTAVGRARQAAAGKFEVSFFGPFFGPYWVIHVEASDEHPYAVALVFSCSRSDQTLWILSRTPELPSSGSSYEQLLDIARSKGVAVDTIKMTPTVQTSCSYPDPDTISKRPSSDSDCDFKLTALGCSPAAWCSYQYRWGDILPSQSCRVRPTECEAEKPVLTAAAASEDSKVMATTAEALGPAGLIAVVVGASVFVGGVLGALIFWRRSNRVSVPMYVAARSAPAKHEAV